MKLMHRKEYETHLKSQPGCQHAEITNTSLVIDSDFPCLACSPDSLVKIPGSQEPLGIAEYKCPYSLAHANPPQTAVEAASDGGKRISTAKLALLETSNLKQGTIITFKYKDSRYYTEGMV